MFNALSGKFFAIVAPFFLVTFSTVVGIYEWNTYRQAHRSLVDHLQVLASSQSIILAEPVAAKDKSRIGLLLATVISDQDLIGVAVHDDRGDLLDSFGTLTTDSPELMKQISINFANEDGFRQVGELLLVMSSGRINAEIRTRVIYDLALALALLVAGIGGATLAHRRIVSKPLERLLVSLSKRQGGSGFEAVEVQSRDEVGRLITAYNEMNTRLAAYEADQMSEQSLLERRVRERTRELDVARRNAETANRAKSRFLASMSHELRTPLNAILGFSQMLDFDPKEPLTPKQADSVKFIHRSGQHLLNLIDEVLELSKIEAEKVDLTLAAIDPGTLITDCVDTIRTSADTRGIVIDNQTRDAGLPIIWADETRFKQVLLNLLSNAVKYNIDNGQVVISGDLKGNDMLRIAVQDSGPGIPIERHGAVFEPFERLGREATDVEGTGIGLVIAKQIMNLMRGTIDFESEAGAGARFWVDIPLAGDEQTTAKAAPTPPISAA